MRYFLETRWPLAAGIAAAVLVLLGGSVLMPADAERLFGLSAAVWVSMCLVLVLGLSVQLLVNSRNALERERRLVRTAAQLREVSAELDQLARTDALTGIANRRAFFDMFGVEFRRAKRYGRPLGILMLDLDHFKHVNDRWGHPFGDYVLREIAGAIARNVRESDLFARYGGEEFALVLPEAGPEQCLAVAEKLRAAVEELALRSEGVPPDADPPVRLTISIGVAGLPLDPEQDEFELIRRADRALYEAKRTGRNRVCLFERDDSPVERPQPEPSASGG